jgi:hypothetical protein
MAAAMIQPLLVALAVAFFLFLLFLYAVREGRFASPGARLAATFSIFVVAGLIWLGPGLLIAR